jgi:hypothetical protein
MKAGQLQGKSAPHDDDPGNPTVDFHGEQRTNDTHQSTTDPEALLARKGKGKESKLSYAAQSLLAGLRQHRPEESLGHFALKQPVPVLGEYRHVPHRVVNCPAHASIFALETLQWPTQPGRRSSLGACKRRGITRHSRRAAEFKLELKRRSNLAEGVAHKVHRLWDRVKHPACGPRGQRIQESLIRHEP